MVSGQNTPKARTSKRFTSVLLGNEYYNPINSYHKASGIPINRIVGEACADFIHIILPRRLKLLALEKEAKKRVQ